MRGRCAPSLSRMWTRTRPHAPTQRVDLRVATVEVVNDESDAQAPVAAAACG